MALFSHYLLAMDLTDMDDALLGYLQCWLQKEDKTPQLHLVHNIKYALDDEMETLLDQPLDVVIQKAIQQKAAKLLPAYATSISVHIYQESSTVAALTKAAAEVSADIMVLGKKINYEGSGITNSKLLRQSPVPLLLVPEHARKRLEKLLVPVDFSKGSAAALKLAQRANTLWQSNIEVQHIYRIPNVYFPFIPVKSMSQSLLSTAKERYREFVKKYQLKEIPPCTFTDGKDQSVVDTLDDYSRAQQKDLIIIGRQGHSALTGSVAIGMSRLDSNKPILMV